jgi:hypothetical protein
MGLGGWRRSRLATPSCHDRPGEPADPRAARPPRRQERRRHPQGFSGAALGPSFRFRGAASMSLPDAPRPTASEGPDAMRRLPSPLPRVAAVASLLVLLLLALSVAPRRAIAQELSMGAYGSVDYRASRVVSADGSKTTSNGFSIPTLDIFLRGSTGNWSFLSEVLFDIDRGNTIRVDLDRMQVGYDVDEWLKITAGRFHTSLGYYNTAYPQGGAVYLLPVDRPIVVDQHDDTSILPTSTVGLNFHGRLPILQRRFSYDVDVTNGRGVQSDDLANGGDANNSKMVNLRLRYEIDGLILGGNALVDWIPPRLNEADPALIQPNTLREQIFGAHIAYVEHPWHIIGEGYVIQHIGPDATHRTIAGISELGYTIGRVTPYARYEFARFPADPDPFWNPLLTHQQERGNYDAVSVGFKIIPNQTFAIKFELEVNRAATDTIYNAGTQVAFGF